MQIAVTDPRRLHPDQDLRSLRPGCRLLDLFQRGIEIDNLKAFHSTPPDVFVLDRIFAPAALSCRSIERYRLFMSGAPQEQAVSATLRRAASAAMTACPKAPPPGTAH